MTVALAGLDVHFELPRTQHMEISQRGLTLLKSAVESANFPVYVYLVECLPGLMGRLAAGGYSCGQSIYATHLYYTDRFVPTALAKIQRDIFDRALKYSVPEYIIAENVITSDNRLHSSLITRCDQLHSRHRPGIRAHYLNNKAREFQQSHSLK